MKPLTSLMPSFLLLFWSLLNVQLVEKELNTESDPFYSLLFPPWVMPGFLPIRPT